MLCGKAGEEIRQLFSFFALSCEKNVFGSLAVKFFCGRISIGMAVTVCTFPIRRNSVFRFAVFQIPRFFRS